MDQGFVKTGIDVGAAAFWIFIGAVVVVSTWAKSRREAEKHETLRRIMEKTGVVDEARLKELFTPEKPAAQQWQSPPGGGHRALRIGGTIIMSIAAGLAVCFLLIGQTGADVVPQRRPWDTHPPGTTVAMERQDGSRIGLAIAAGIALLGAGMFFSARFAEPPPPREGKDKTLAR